MNFTEITNLSPVALFPFHVRVIYLVSEMQPLRSPPVFTTLTVGKQARCSDRKCYWHKLPIKTLSSKVVHRYT